MGLISGLAVFFIVWWLVLFTVLPWGVQNTHEAGENSEPGNATGAPVRPQILVKFAITTVIAIGVFAVLYAVMSFELVSLDDIPFLPSYDS
jgi:predicted secreted protein